MPAIPRNAAHRLGWYWPAPLNQHPARTLVFAGAPPADGGGLGAVADGAVEEAEQLRHTVILRLGRRGIVAGRLLCEQQVLRSAFKLDVKLET